MESEDDAPKGLGTVGFAAKWAGGITLLCIIVGQSAEHYAAALPPTQPGIIGASSLAQPKADGVDPESVGAIKTPLARPGPCRD
jgi:hypothetical protein